MIENHILHRHRAGGVMCNPRNTHTQGSMCLTACTAHWQQYLSVGSEPVYPSEYIFQPPSSMSRSEGGRGGRKERRAPKSDIKIVFSSGEWGRCEVGVWNPWHSNDVAAYGVTFW
jgi:hypothetical protein